MDEARAALGPHAEGVLHIGHRLKRAVGVHRHRVQRCGGCDGTAKRKVQSGAGHVSWAKTVACPDCYGSGHVSRWIPLSELKALLERQPRD